MKMAKAAQGMTEQEKIDNYMKEYGVTKEKAENYIKMTHLLQDYRKTNSTKAVRKDEK